MIGRSLFCVQISVESFVLRRSYLLWDSFGFYQGIGFLLTSISGLFYVASLYYVFGNFVCEL